MSSPESPTFLKLTAEATRRPSTFLSLIPDRSNSYPEKSSASQAPIDAAERRKSSVSGPKILKLNPVYWGEHLSEHKDDFHEVAVVSP